jgi:hypothetical protein
VQALELLTNVERGLERRERHCAAPTRCVCLPPRKSQCEPFTP